MDKYNGYKLIMKNALNVNESFVTLLTSLLAAFLTRNFSDIATVHILLTIYKMYRVMYNILYTEGIV